MTVTLVHDVDGGEAVGRVLGVRGSGYVGTVFPAQFSCEPKIAPKNCL